MGNELKKGYAQSVGIKIDIESKDLDKKIRQIFNLTSKSLPDVVKQVSIAFLQSAGAATAVSKKGRGLSRIENGDHFHFGEDKYGNEIGYKVPFKRKINNKNGQRYFTRYFRTYAEAAKYTKITYWGLTRAGWVGNLFKLGKSPSLKNSKLASLLDKINAVRNIGKEIEVRNKVLGVSSYALYTLKEGFFNANIRLKWYIKDLERKMERAFR